jgi:hypothetical protein
VVNKYLIVHIWQASFTKVEKKWIKCKSEQKKVKWEGGLGYDGEDWVLMGSNEF